MSLNLKESPPTSEWTVDRMVWVFVCGDSISISISNSIADIRKQRRIQQLLR